MEEGSRLARKKFGVEKERALEIQNFRDKIRQEAIEESRIRKPAALELFQHYKL